MKIIHFALVFAFVGFGSCFAQSSAQVQISGPLGGGPVLANVGTGQPFTSMVVTGQPFTADAIIETDQTLADGSHIANQQTVTAARDSQGRTRREEIVAGQAGGGQQQKTVFISDPVAQINYVLGPDHVARQLPSPAGGSQPGMISTSTNNAATQGSQSGQHFRIARAGIGTKGPVLAGTQGTPQVQQITLGESKSDPLGSESIGGVQADGNRTTLTVPAGQVGNQNPLVITDERWFSQELQATVLAKHTDPRFGNSSYQLTNIQRTEPPASLFQVPSDYTVEGTDK